MSGSISRSARPAIEARLSLGLSGADAFAPHQRTIVRTALIPALDSTKTGGVISLPGAMTGLILAGVDPLTAIRYQSVVVYMMLAAAALAALVAVRLAERALFDDAHRLRPIRTRQGSGPSPSAPSSCGCNSAPERFSTTPGSSCGPETCTDRSVSRPTPLA
ncbi:ABC transporter permease [Streptomyces sp. NPDC056817]|uniref:ABC transporter permease n=1 Tax=Streptomyces sp. NPDC056817 TaxID=3345950 RepID=UPI0036AA1D9C